jgi:hypothetical protein
MTIESVERRPSARGPGAQAAKATGGNRATGCTHSRHTAGRVSREFSLIGWLAISLALLATAALVFLLWMSA